MPAKTNTAARPEAAKRFKFLDVKRFLLLVSNVADVVPPLRRSPAAIVTLASIDDHRERLKLIWSFSEAADSM
jgi:hypothetical protein